MAALRVIMTAITHLLASRALEVRGMAVLRSADFRIAFQHQNQRCHSFSLSITWKWLLDAGVFYHGRPPFTRSLLPRDVRPRESISFT